MSNLVFEMRHNIIFRIVYYVSGSLEFFSRTFLRVRGARFMAVPEIMFSSFRENTKRHFEISFSRENWLLNMTWSNLRFNV